MDSGYSEIGMGDRADQNRDIEQAANQFRFLVDGVKEYAIYMLDTEGHIVSWNQGAERIKGYRPHEVIGLHFSMFYPDEDIESGKPPRLLKRALSEGSYEEEGWRLRKDGSRFWANVLITSLWDERRNLRGFTKVVRDVSERRRAEEEAQRSEAKARAVLETAVDGIITIDRTGLIESFNPAAERTFGYDAEEVLGRKINMLMPPPDSELHDTYIENYLRTGQRKIIGIGREVVGLRKDGSTFPMDLAISEVKIGDEVSFTGIVRDISERKSAEERLATLVKESQQTARELAAANAAKDELLALISHELRTPVTTIHGSANLLRRNRHKLSDKNIAELIEGVEEESQRLKLLIESLLSIARFDLGRSESSEPVRIDMLIQKALATFAKRTPGREVRLKLKDDLPIIEAVPTHLEHVLLNLLENAHKYSPVDSPIHIEANPAEGGRYVEVRVLDRGTGIGPEETELIFESFYRSPVNSRTAEGRGLGLTLCKRLVEIHRGDIWSRLRAGGGLEVGFRLPAALIDSSPMDEPAPEASKGQK
jgi:PAS domain S-box-containing protein